MALLHENVDDDILRRADSAFAHCGITTPMAIKMMVMQELSHAKDPEGIKVLAPAENDVDVGVAVDLVPRVGAEEAHRIHAVTCEQGQDHTRISSMV